MTPLEASFTFYPERREYLYFYGYFGLLSLMLDSMRYSKTSTSIYNAESYDMFGLGVGQGRSEISHFVRVFGSEIGGIEPLPRENIIPPCPSKSEVPRHPLRTPSLPHPLYFPLSALSSSYSCSCMAPPSCVVRPPHLPSNIC